MRKLFGGNRLEDQDYFHGLLPREDLSAVLSENGDFVVRESEPTSGAHREIIISVLVNREKKEDKEGIKHVVVWKKHNEFTTTNEGSRFFKTVPELITFYRKEKLSLVANHEVVIKNPASRQPWELLHEDITLERTLGSGAYGEVKAGKLKKSFGRKVNVAVKLARTATLTKEQIKEYMSEARILRGLDHPNVVQMHGVAVEQEPLMIVMELVDGGSLKSYLTEHKVPIDEKCKKMCAGAAYGIEYLHSVHKMHRDIAARNCLYTSDKIVKVSDFGLTRDGDIYKMKTNRRMPVKWCAPEVVENRVFTTKADVYTFGMLMWEIFANGEEPYHGLNNHEAFTLIKRHRHPEIPHGTPEEAIAIMKRCWEKESRRCTMADVVKDMEKSWKVTPPVRHVLPE